MIHASNESELTDALKKTDTSVPKRTEGRTKQHTETYAICYLMSTLLKEAKIVFPLYLEKTERPDFILSMAGTKIGIEHTEAVAQNVAQADALREQGHGAEALFIKRSYPNEKKKKAKDLIRQMEENNPGTGWIGNSVEVDWSDAMAHFAESKSEVAKKDGFKLYEENWLLIYDNWRLPGVILEEAVLILMNKLVQSCAFSVFNKIYVICGEHLCQFKIDQSTVYELSELWQES